VSLGPFAVEQLEDALGTGAVVTIATPGHDGLQAVR
jgi:hypothetical protein